MLFRHLNFIPFLRTSGLKKNIILGNQIKVKTNIWILITCIFTYIHSMNLAFVLNSLCCEMSFLDFKNPVNFVKMHGALRFMDSIQQGF